MTYRSAKAYIRKNFTAGIYSGDNPYLTEVTVESLLNRWQESGTITTDVHLRLQIEFCK